MSLRVVWNPPALAYWDRLSTADKLRLERAVYGYAERGEGRLFWDPPYDRLRAGRYLAAVRVDREADELHVLFVQRVAGP